MAVLVVGVEVEEPVGVVGVEVKAAWMVQTGMEMVVVVMMKSTIAAVEAAVVAVDAVVAVVAVAEVELVYLEQVVADFRQAD